uniref:Anoctamin dimerisation domain-containing protein n=1 Tax=Oryzias melastigma TaxID=30732 RepID=A0A3B3CCM3_ORYME
MTVIPPLLPQLLKALTPEENTRCQRGLFFQDGQRRVDYILTYPVKKPGGGHSPSSEPSAGADVETGCPAETLNTQEDDKAFKREEFEEKLRGMGLELEKDEEGKIPGLGFVKIHAPWSVLCREAELMKLKMPSKKVYEVKQLSGVVKKISSLVNKVLEPLHPHVEEHQKKNIKHLSLTFSREKQHLSPCSNANMRPAAAFK